MALVSCARVGDALTKWLDSASELKKDELCEALGCQGVTDEEITAVFLTCDGVAHIPGASIPTCEEMEAAIDEAIAAIFVGGDADQVWTKRADGTQGWAEIPDEPCYVPVEQTTGVTRPLTLEDNGKLLMGGPISIVIPVGSTSWPIGFRVDLVGEVTVAVTGGTLRSVDGNTKVVADGGATLIKTSATEFWLAGALEA